VAADSKVKLLKDAEKYVLSGKTRQAISAYKKVTELDPNDVLILNTIGDLYLRQNNWVEASQYFLRVAESYVRNNFFLKAIAVYKKILNSDPNNFEVNSTMASLYAKQGLSTEACKKYLQVIELLEKEGKLKEVLGIYEKIAELDPFNSKIQQKLADLHLAEGAKEKANTYYLGAARAQIKAGDLAAAVDSYQSAMQITPLNVIAMKGFIECCFKMGDPRPALEQLKESVEVDPQNLDMRELLGQAFLETGDVESATKAFQVVVSMDESRYENFFSVAQILIDRNAYDQTLDCLDNIIPILITQRKAERAVQLYELILQRQPKHVPALTKLASVYSAIGDQSRYLEIQDQLADHYFNDNHPIEALTYIEKILQVDPANEKHRQLHYQAFLAAYPDVLYVPPAEPPASSSETGSILVERDYANSPEGSISENLVEVDLLLNYGLKEKALNLLLNLESQDPGDKEVRTRLLSFYKTEKKNGEAAEQSLLLAAIYRAENDEECYQRYLDEANQLDPEMVSDNMDLSEFARGHGIIERYSIKEPAIKESQDADAEVDLSSDLFSTFFMNGKKGADNEDGGKAEAPEIMAEGYSPNIPLPSSVKSLEDQFQEVDFYIRLGFKDEALDKLNEIAGISPNNPEVDLRYEKLGKTKPKRETADAIEIDASRQPAFSQSEDLPSPGIGNALQPPDAASIDIRKPAGPVSGVNEMFADLMDEAISPESQEKAKETFEDHFSMGIAYREMELMEDAIREFEIALKGIDMQKRDPRVIQCCGMLSTCFLKKNMSRSALRWCQTGLNLVEASSHEAMAFHYDMGIAHSMAGNSEKALECFDRIFSVDPGYRDVAQRIDELKGGIQRHAP
jgi:tetratricopeptide (TPR) repeat protein